MAIVASLFPNREKVYSASHNTISLVLEHFDFTKGSLDKMSAVCEIYKAESWAANS